MAIALAREGAAVAVTNLAAEQRDAADIIDGVQQAGRVRAQLPGGLAAVAADGAPLLRLRGASVAP